MENNNENYQAVFNKAYVISCISEMTVFCIFPTVIIVCIPLLIFSLPWHPLLLATVLVVVLCVFVCWCRRFTKVTTQEYLDEITLRNEAIAAAQESNFFYSLRTFIHGINSPANPHMGEQTLSNATTQTVVGSDSSDFDPPAYESLLSPQEQEVNNRVSNMSMTQQQRDKVDNRPDIILNINTIGMNRQHNSINSNSATSNRDLILPLNDLNTYHQHHNHHNQDLSLLPLSLSYGRNPDRDLHLPSMYGRYSDNLSLSPRYGLNSEGDLILPPNYDRQVVLGRNLTPPPTYEVATHNLSSL